MPTNRELRRLDGMYRIDLHDMPEGLVTSLPDVHPITSWLRNRYINLDDRRLERYGSSEYKAAGNASVWTGVIFGLRAKVVACPQLLNWILVVIGSRAIFARAKKPTHVLVLARVSRFAFVRRCWCFGELFKDAILRNLVVRQGLIFGN